MLIILCFAFVQKTQEGQIMAGIYNALVKVQLFPKAIRSKNVNHTYNAQWEFIRFRSSTNVFAMLHVLTECLSQTGYSGWAVCQAWWCRAECTIPSDSRHVRTAGGNRERFQSVTMELTGYTPPKVLVIRTEVTRTICQVIFHMMMRLQDSKNRVWLRMDIAYTYTCTAVGQWHWSFIFIK